MSIFGTLIGGALGFIGGERQNDANREINSANNAFNAQEAEKNRTFQTETNKIAHDFTAGQSATQYQRAVKDLQLAGLNPMLAYTQGGNHAASGVTSAGSTAQSSGNARIENSLAQGVQSALAATQVKQAEAQVDNIIADTGVKTAAEEVNKETANEIRARTPVHPQAVNESIERTKTYPPTITELQSRSEQQRASAGQIAAQEKLTLEQIPKVQQEVKLAIAETSYVWAKKKLTDIQQILTTTEEKLRNSQIKQTEVNVIMQQVQTGLIELEKEIKRNELPERENQADVSTGPLGKNLTLIERVMKALSPFKK